MSKCSESLSPFSSFNNTRLLSDTASNHPAPGFETPDPDRTFGDGTQKGQVPPPVASHRVLRRKCVVGILKGMILSLLLGVLGGASKELLSAGVDSCIVVGRSPKRGVVLSHIGVSKIEAKSLILKYRERKHTNDVALCGGLAKHISATERGFAGDGFRDGLQTV